MKYGLTKSVLVACPALIVPILCLAAVSAPTHGAPPPDRVMSLSREAPAKGGALAKGQYEVAPAANASEGGGAAFSNVNEHQSQTHGWFWATAMASLLLIANGYFLLRQQRFQKRLMELNVELNRSRHELQATLDAIPDVFFKVDAEGHYLDLRSSDEQLLALPRNALLGKKITEILPHEAASQCMQAIREAQATGKSSGTQYALDLAHGKRWFELSIACKQTSPDTPAVFIAIARDITEHKKYQEALLQRADLQKQLAALAEAVPGCLFTLQLTPDGQARYPYASAGLEALFGLHPDEIRDDAAVLRARYHPEDLPRGMALLQESARTLMPLRVDMRVQNPERGMLWIELRSQPHLLENGTVEWHGLMIDITERKRLEEALKESEARYRYNSGLLQSIFESQYDVSIYALDREYRYLAFNGKFREAAKRLWNGDIAVGMNMLDVIDTEDHREFARQGFDQVLAGRSFMLESNEALVKDGVTDYEYHENYGSPIRDDRGEIIGLTVFAINITERKRMEMALQESEARYRYNSNLLQSIFESSRNVSIYALDREYRYMTFNARARANAKRKWRTEIAVGMCMLDVVDTEGHRDFCRQGFDQVLAGRSFSLESKEPVVTEGVTSYEYNENHASPIRDDHGEIIGLTIFAINITERKRMEESLDRERAKLQAFFRSLPALAWMKDPDGRIVACNPLFEQLYDAPEAEIVGKTDADFVGAEQAAFFRQKDTEAMSAGGPIVFEEPVIFASDGRHAIVETVKSPVFDTNGNMIGVLGMAHDITERKRAEVALARSEREFRTLVDNLPDVVIRYDRDCRRIFVNKAVSTISGLPATQLINASPEEAKSYGPEIKRRVLNALRQTFESGERQEVDVEYGGRDYVMLIVPELDCEGRVATALSIARDVTAIRSVERSISRFLANAPAFVFAYRIATDGRRSVPFASSGIQRILGIRPEQIKEDSSLLASVVAAADLQRIQDAITESRRALTPVQIEFRICQTEGSERWFEIRAEPEKEADGSLSWQGIMFDITERKQAEIALARSEREFRTLVENLPDYIARYDVEGHFRYINPNLAMLTGISSETAATATAASLLRTDEARSAYLKAFSATLRDGDIHEVELTFPRLDHTLIQHQVRLVAERDEHGQITGILTIGHDITELKQKEHELENSRNLLLRLSAHRDSAREEERKHIAREIHDHLGQLLTAQRLEIATLKLLIADDPKTLRARCQHLLEITDLTIQSVRNLAAMLRPSSLDMGIVPALEWLSNNFRKQNKIDCDLIIGKDQKFNLDEKQSLAVFRIVQESLTNIARHAEATWVGIHLDMSGDNLRLLIRDNGKGFDPSKIEATSFGLLGIRERALMIGGKAIIHSTPLEGTTIDVVLPLRDANNAPL